MSTRAKPWSSTAFRLALQFAGLMVLTMAIVLAVFYVQTVGVLRARVDRQAEAHLKRLVEHSGKYGQEALEAEIRHRRESHLQLESRLAQLEGELAQWSQTAETLAVDRQKWPKINSCPAPPPTVTSSVGR